MRQQTWIAIWAMFVAVGLVWGAPCLGLPPTGSQEILWFDDFDEAMRLAQSENKPLLLHFYGEHCPPCRMLESKAFRDRNLISTLNNNLVAVRINADKERSIAQRYQVNRWPTDVYLFPDGKEIYRGVCNQDPATYAKTVERIALRHRDWSLEQVAMREAQLEREKKSNASRLSAVKTKIAPDAAINPHPVRVTSANWSQGNGVPVGDGPSVVRRSETSPGSNPIAHPDRRTAGDRDVTVIAVSDHIEPTAPSPSALQTTSPIAPPVADVVAVDEAAQQRRRADQLETLGSIPGLGGYCPVSLQDSIRAAQLREPAGQAWVPGRPEFAIRHRGRVYRCASEEARRRMLQDPDRYAPILSGCDLVEFVRTGDLVNGNCEFGFIEQKTGRVFLFASRDHYDEFARNCDAYSPSATETTQRLASDPNPTARR